MNPITVKDLKEALENVPEWMCVYLCVMERPYVPIVRTKQDEDEDGGVFLLFPGEELR